MTEFTAIIVELTGIDAALVLLRRERNAPGVLTFRANSAARPPTAHR
jgi:hypothetical protein